MQTIDLNCDMGELKPGQDRNYDAEIMPFISSCNIACGFHSGSPELIDRTIQLAITHNTQIGAHPSYHDREHFGRISIAVDIKTLLAELRYQICAVKGMVESHGAKLNHVKPHGALYNDMAANRALSDQFVALVKSIDPDLKIFALAHSQLVTACQAGGVVSINEGFADRRYEKVNQLRSRKLEGAVLHDPEVVKEQIANFLKGKVQLYNSTLHNIQVDSICLHSDTQGAAGLSKMIYDFLKEKHVNIAANI